LVPQKFNLRRPDIMEAVQAQVLTHYRSELVNASRRRRRAFRRRTHREAREEFGFCYGVERAIDLAYAAKKHFSEVSPHTPIYLLGEINPQPEVNDQIRNMGIQIISPKPTDEDLSSPAIRRCRDHSRVWHRGRHAQKNRGQRVVIIVDTTCGDVMSVWKRVRQYSKESVTSIIHARPSTRRPRPPRRRRAPTAVAIISLCSRSRKRITSAITFCTEATRANFRQIQRRFFRRLRPGLHLQAVGLANQTTMLRGRNREVQRRHQTGNDPEIRRGEIEKHFRFFDTICGAPRTARTALQNPGRTDEPARRHRRLQFIQYVDLAEMGEAKLPDISSFKTRGKMGFPTS